jgi:hypothetical protein
VKQTPVTTEELAMAEAAPSGIGRTARLAAYLAERFPLLAHGVLILSFYSSNQFLAHALLAPGQPMRYDLRSLMGYVAIFGFFLHLRIFDDHKDYVEDCRYYPERVLQRGVVSLHELKGLAVAAIGLELLMGFLAGPAALVSVLMVFAFSLLMLKEFFVREWLRRHFVIYVSSHMMIMPLLALVVFSFSTGCYPWQAPGWYWLYSFVGFFVAFNWEVSRKIRAPEEEIDGLDSYTKLCGTYGAAYLVLAIRVVDTGLVTMVARHLNFSAWFYGWLLILFLLCMVGFFQYRFRTTPVTARRMATYAGFYIVAFDLALAAELVRTYGISLGGLS